MAFDQSADFTVLSKPGCRHASRPWPGCGLVGIVPAGEGRSERRYWHGHEACLTSQGPATQSAPVHAANTMPIC